MANQFNVNKFRMAIHPTLDTVAKIRTYVKGKTVAMEPRVGQKLHKLTRKMSVIDFIEHRAEEAVKDVKADLESLEWMQKQLGKNIESRKKQDAKTRAGAFRKPRSEWKKPGRKVGSKNSAKWAAAMKALGEKRKEMTKQGKSWRKTKNSKGKKQLG